MAESLEQLLDDRGPTTSPGSRAGEESEGLARTPERIRVVADVRTNSLIIRCPADQVNELPDLLAAIARLDREVPKK